MMTLAAGGGFYYLLHSVKAAGPLPQEKLVNIVRGTGVAAIGLQMEQEGAISNRQLFRIAHFLKGSPDLKAGEYKLPAGISIDDLLNKMEKGAVFARRVTVPEGWTSLEVYYALMKQQELTGTIDVLPPDGTLLPETYQYEKNETRANIIKRMQQGMRNAVLAAWEAREPDLPLAGPDHLLTLASIVEKETGVAAERAKVAGVFINRLRKNMPLQSDPTVIYGITGGRALFTRTLTYDDLKKETAYNTYTIPALPPGPIANPGRAALMAVAKPEKHNFLYFVADGTGGHAFAETLEQHNANVANWRKVQKEEKKP